MYPYDYMYSWEMCEELQLQPKEAVYSELNGEGIKDSDYEHAQRVWNTFGIQNMGKYSDLYVKSDVLMLTVVLENFRDVCIRTYELDPAWYFIVPGHT